MSAAAAAAKAAQQVSRRGAGPDTFPNRMRERARNAVVYWRREYAKGTNSSWFVVVAGGAILYTVYKLAVGYVIPWRLQRMEGSGMVSIRIPMSEEHQKEVGFNSRTPLRAAMEEKGVNFKYPPETLTAPQEVYQRAVVAAEVPSEKAAEPTNFTVLSLREYDHEKKHDVFIRTLYALRAPDPEGTKPNSREVQKRLNSSKKLSNFGETIQHAQVKCKAITPTDNCVPLHDPMTEVLRKMLVGLGPMFMLRHPGHETLPKRWSKFVEPKNMDILMLGMNDGGAASMWINRVFPHYKLDIVEPDAGLVRTCRHFLGWQERDGMALAVEEPITYLRRRVLSSKRYQAVFVDMIDENGNVPTNLFKLETLTNIRDSLNERGTFVLNLPNHDEKRMAAIIQNVRLAFEGRAVILLHCQTTPNTILFTFNDSGDKGMPKFGYTGSSQDFQGLLRVIMLNFPRRFNFDLLAEVHERNFQQLVPGRKYQFRRPTGGTYDPTVPQSV